MNYIEHIGIAVKDIKKSNELYASLLGTDPYKMEEVPYTRTCDDLFLQNWK